MECRPQSARVEPSRGKFMVFARRGIGQQTPIGLRIFGQNARSVFSTDSQTGLGGLASVPIVKVPVAPGEHRRLAPTANERSPMRIEVKGRNLRVTDELREVIERRFEKVAKQVSPLAVLEFEL